MSDARAGYKRDGACAGIGDAGAEPEHAVASAEFSELVRDTFLRVASMRDTTAADHVVIDLMLSRGESADLIVQHTAPMSRTSKRSRRLAFALRRRLVFAPRKNVTERLDELPKPKPTAAFAQPRPSDCRHAHAATTHHSVTPHSGFHEAKSPTTTTHRRHCTNRRSGAASSAPLDPK